MAETPTQDYLKECFDYDKDSGKFIWKIRPENHFKTIKAFKIWNKTFPGKEAGSFNDSLGYITIGLRGKNWFAHRLAWVWMTGELPEKIDHINHNGYDNRWSNLRNVTQKENTRNQTKNEKNTSGHNGVYWDKQTKKWRAKIKVDGKTICLGRFTDIEDALDARSYANIQYGFHELHGESNG